MPVSVGPGTGQTVAMSSPDAAPETVDRDVLRIDGRVVRIRSVRQSDREALIRLNESSSDKSIFLRFSTGNRQLADRYVEQILKPLTRIHQEIVAVVGEEIVGVCGYEGLTQDSAEVALLVADSHHHEGLGTLMLEHLANIARSYGYSRFDAEVLLQNRPMLKTFRDLGYERTFETESGLTHVVIALEQTPQSVAVIDERDRVADAASMQAVLAPTSVAVIGIGEGRHDRGLAVIRGLLGRGYRGPVMPVDPRHRSVLGLPCVPSAKDLPLPADLAVIAVAEDQVMDVVRDCGERGVRAVVMLTGFNLDDGGSRLQDDVLEIVRGHGMRMVGPNCLGVINTDPEVQLNATYSPLHVGPGTLALASQSGVIGMTAIEEARRRGLGIAQFVSMGNKADVSGNDLLNSWEQDPRCRVIGLYLESLGNPRKFARLAKRVARTKPIVAIKAGRTRGEQVDGGTYTKAAASEEVSLQALFAESGVVRVATVDEMIDVARLLADQPLPRGTRVALIGNAHGPLVLAADAMVGAGLELASFDETFVSDLRRTFPRRRGGENPLDLGDNATPTDMALAAKMVGDCPAVDAVVVVASQILIPVGDELLGAAAQAAAGSHKPMLGVRPGGSGHAAIASGNTRIPVYEFPESAALALAGAWAYARIASSVEAPAVELPGVDETAARDLVSGHDAAGGGWLGTEDAAALLACYGITMCPQRVVASEDEAVATASEFGYPVALKQANFLVHVEEPIATRLYLRDQAELRAAYVELAGEPARPVLVQRMLRSGTEMIIGAVQDPQLGPLVMVGAGGVFADVVGDRALHLAPIARHTALEAIQGLRVARLLNGIGGRPAADPAPLADLMVRVAAMADDLPELAELDLNPIICRGDEATVVNAMIRIDSPSARIDPYLRALRRPR